MRIAYGVHGYGRGHATRAQALLAELSTRHEVVLFAGGNAHEVLAARHEVRRIPSLDLAYTGPRVSWRRTLAANAGLLADLWLGGPCSRAVHGLLREQRPDVILSDSEPFLLRAARELLVPSIGLDHVGVIAHCRPEVPLADRPRLTLDAALYRLLLGRADQVIVSSFFTPAEVRPGVHVVPPILRDAVLRAQPTDGEHVLVYFNSGRLLTGAVASALGALGVRVVAYGADRVGVDGLVTYRPFDAAAFVEDLASCRAVLATGGHQLIAEALHLGKPMLLCPEGTAEQRLNAREAERMGVARAIPHRDLSAGVLRQFLAELAGPRAALGRLARPGNGRIAEAVERLAAELTGREPVGAVGQAL